MAKEEAIEVEGKVKEAPPQYDVPGRGRRAGHVILAHLSGENEKAPYIRIVPGDTVKVALSPYDLNRGRIIYRER
ncbi:MAG: translation initiation factor IF-1 [Anaerotruncus sp.]|nr:translation initiation factor IF-1 [Anaerotruncus sp.]